MPEEEQKILRIEIDGTWTSSEFARFLNVIGDVYIVHVILATRKGIDGLSKWLSKGDRPFSYYGYEELYIRRIGFGSPGSIDLGGLGPIVGHIADFVFRLIHLRTGKEERRLANEERQERIRAAKIKNAERLVSLGKKIGLSNEQLQIMVFRLDLRQDFLLELADQGKIKGVQLLDQTGADASVDHSLVAHKMATDKDRPRQIPRPPSPPPRRKKPPEGPKQKF
jgi:hypothetical protein